MERPYTYTEQINHLKGTVELGFMIQDTSEAVLIPNCPDTGNPGKAVYRPGGCEVRRHHGSARLGEVPSETKFMETVENAARDRLLREAEGKVASLPPLILQTADRKAPRRTTMEPQSYICFTSTPRLAKLHLRGKGHRSFCWITTIFEPTVNRRNRDLPPFLRRADEAPRAQLRENDLNSQKPEKIGKYDVLDVLGRGGMGVVYRARDSRLGRIVAIKMLTEGFSGNAEMLQRFYREASQTGALRHNNIVIVYDAGDQDGEPYIVMEYVEGEPLDKAIKRQRLQLEHALSVVEQICLALAYAHRNGVIHRDIKPANVIVRGDGSVKLLDFGIARDETRVDTSITSTGSLVGTPPYMAPERFGGAPIDGRSDIFSAGVLLYLLLTGRLPFDAEYPGVIDQIMRAHPPAPSELIENCPAGLDAIVARALAKSRWTGMGMLMTWRWTCTRWPKASPAPISPNRWPKRNSMSTNTIFWLPKVRCASCCVWTPST